ncbi:MAG: prolyl oligopeptidase family serine peptidase, partial [Verrucomicrobiales bacterium]|nr:prolyl oligopeptidase family serine peptidase [Verrucomicrobiales bacterium]
VGILGFSAGGHLTLMTSLHANERTYTMDPALDVDDATPNFAVPVYPAYLVDEKNKEELKLLPEMVVTPKAPPICFVHANDDRWSAAGRALIYLEYKKLGLPAEVHIYAKGGHGFGMRKNGLPVNDWPVRVGEWMKSMGWLE